MPDLTPRHARAMPRKVEQAHLLPSCLIDLSSLFLPIFDCPSCLVQRHFRTLLPFRETSSLRQLPDPLFSHHTAVNKTTCQHNSFY
jgi:hypothetical protein